MSLRPMVPSAQRNLHLLVTGQKICASGLRLKVICACLLRRKGGLLQREKVRDRLAIIRS
jgi:hypothetical protein